jgi:hypothetical protein
LSEDFRDRPTDVGIVVGQRHVHSLREHQGRADLEHRVHGHIEEKLRCGRARQDYRWPSTWSATQGPEARKRRDASVAEAKIEIAEVVDRWLAPDHRCFNVRDGDGDLYILRNGVASERWELTFFRRRANGAEMSSPATD